MLARMANYAVKFGGAIGGQKLFGELEIDGAPMDEQTVRGRVLQIAGQLMAEGAKLNDATVGPFGEALAARLSKEMPNTKFRVTQLVAPKN